MHFSVEKTICYVLVKAEDVKVSRLDFPEKCERVVLNLMSSNFGHFQYWK